MENTAPAPAMLPAIPPARRKHAGRGRGQAPPVTADQVTEIIAVARRRD